VKLPFVGNGAPAQKRVARAPRTQDQVLAVALQDDLLVLRNLGVVAALEVESVDDALLAPEELESRLAIWRYDFLKQARYDFQVLIGTRPQDLTPYYEQLAAQAGAWAAGEARLQALLDGMDEVLGEWSAGGSGGEAAFQARFGFAPADLAGLPGEAREAAWALAEPRTVERWRKMDEAAREGLAAALRAAVLGSLERVQHYQALLHERAAFLQVATQQMQAPVRTVHVVISHYPRPLTGGLAGGPLSEREIALAREELDKRCDQIARVLRRMRLGARRCGGEELLALVRAFYHPSSAQMARRREA